MPSPFPEPAVGPSGEENRRKEESGQATQGRSGGSSASRSMTGSNGSPLAAATAVFGK